MTRASGSRCFGQGQELHAVHARHLQVGEDQVEGLLFQELRGLQRVVGGGHLVVGIALDDHLQQGQHVQFVIDGQYTSHPCEPPQLAACLASGEWAAAVSGCRMMKKVVPVEPPADSPAARDSKRILPPYLLMMA